MRHSIQNALLLCVLFGFSHHSQAQNKTTVAVNGAPDVLLGGEIQANVSRFLTTINVAFYKEASPEFAEEIAEEGRQSINLLWGNVPFFCPMTRLTLDLLETTSGFELRNVPLILKAFDEAGQRQSREGVVILSGDGQITDMQFGLEENQYSALLRNPIDQIDYRRKQVILSFAEKVRTAYNRKDLPLIESVYSDNALIIIGRVVVEEKSGATEGVGSPRIAYIKRKKSEYLDQLKKVFDSNEFINVDFEDIKIVRHPAHQDIYGVTVLQFWESSSYRDAGYLFLMVDFREEDRPIIHVRTWQPKIEVTEGEVFQLNDFWINKRSN